MIQCDDSMCNGMMMVGEASVGLFFVFFACLEPSLRDTQYVHEAYVTIYIAKERNKSIAQVGILTNALLVQYICWIWFNNQ
jgi:hypothetical protein